MATSSFAALLRQHRLASGLTQEELAERAGLSGRAISDLERGLKQAPRPSTVRLLVRGLGVPEVEAAALLHTAQPRRGPVPATEPGYDRHTLPLPLSSFVGRAREVDEVCELLQRVPLLTLTGTGGIGKTRLALEVARGLVDAVPGGVWLVDLTPLANPDLVPQAVATALGIPEQPSRPLLEVVTDALRQRRPLLVLDNCEHVVGACARLAEHVLQNCPEVHILATSRETLGIPGETAWRVPGLALPNSSDQPSPQDLLETEAVRLFVERAAAAAPGFCPTDHTAAVVDICRQLDGMPLAIELAAARSKVLTPDQIAVRLSDRFRLLASAVRTAARRQQTLRATVDWSYDILSDAERTLFNRLSVFAGGCSLEAAEAVCADPEQAAQIAGEDVLDLLARLVDRSLLETESTDGSIRFRFLETLRQYAAERLRASGHLAMLRTRHLDWCLTIGDAVWSGIEEALWLARVDREQDNVRAALAGALEHPSTAEAALRLAGDMYLFWWRRGYVGEGRAWLARALELDSRSGTSASVAAKQARQRALRGAGILARNQNDFAAADAMFSASLGLSRELDDPASIAQDLFWLGSNALYLGDESRARALSEESVGLYRQFTDPERAHWIYGPLGALANLAFRRGDYRQEKALLDERLRHARDAGDSRGIAAAVVALGMVASERGEHDRAKELFDASREVYSKLGDRSSGAAWAIRHAARAARARGDRAEAVELLGESLRMFQKLGALGGMAECLEGLAALAADAGEAEHAAELFGSAAALRDTEGRILGPRAARAARAGDRFRSQSAANVRKQERELAALRAVLGPHRFEAAWQCGRERPVSDAVAAALTTTASQSGKPIAAPKLREGAPPVSADDEPSRRADHE